MPSEKKRPLPLRKKSIQGLRTINISNILLHSKRHTNRAHSKRADVKGTPKVLARHRATRWRALLREFFTTEAVGDGTSGWDAPADTSRYDAVDHMS